MKRFLVGTLLLGAACGTAAGGEGGIGGHGGGGHGGEEPPVVAPLELAWAPCTLLAGPLQVLPAQCASVEVPLDWARPEAGSIELFVKRLPARAPGGKSLWMLQGGPGGPGSDLEGLAALIAGESPGVTVYLPDHRGTGASTRIGCPDQEAVGSDAGTSLTMDEVVPCAEAAIASWGEKLAHFSTTQAAEDLFRLVEATGAEGEAPFVIGFSYGTYWAHRYLQLHPDQAAGVILDSMCAPGACNLARMDEWHDGVAREIFESCAGHEVCGAKLGNDPWGRLRLLHERLAAGGHCTEVAGLDGIQLRLLLGALTTSVYLRELAPPLVYRALRCEAGDVAVLRRLFSDEPAPPSTEPSGHSFLLGANIVLSELWEEPAPSQEEMWERFLATSVAQAASQPDARLAPIWPRYREPLAGSFARTDVPMLMLSGGLDPLTPLAVQQPLAARFTGPAQHHVVVPRAGHVVVARSPLQDEDPARSCGLALLTRFLADPTAPPDTGCVDRVRRADYAYLPNVQHFFGTTDPWDN